jgi:formiminoglutamate deiminase
MTAYHCRRAVLPGGVESDVLVESVDGLVTDVAIGIACPAGVTPLGGLTFPGFANAHSHAFHRALRGRTQGARGSFWTWREQMYAVAERLDPDTYYSLARAVYAEMVLAGYSCVGEFHYLHHGPGGHPYADPNAMSHALTAAAADAGIRLTLLDTCYLTGGIGAPLTAVQQRFGDGDGHSWAMRVDAFRPSGTHTRVGVAIHSVRAVPAAEIPVVAGWAAEAGAPLHVHVSEQRAENDACRLAYDRSPAQLLADAGALTARTTAVHAVHIDAADIALLGRHSVTGCACPSTERDLADGLAPVTDLRAAGGRTCLGTDAHVSIDPFAEMRGLEYGERLRTERRGNLTSAELLDAATDFGHAALGWPGAGRIAVGAPADLTAVSLAGIRFAGVTAGNELDAAIFGATAADVTDVVIGGRHVVRDGRHTGMGDVTGALRQAIAAVATS